MSPEQILSAKHADARSDIWSLGVTLYELVTGALPFAERSIPALVASIVGCEPVPLSALRPDAPAELAAIVARCLAKRPEDRYPEIDALARDLRALREDAISDDESDDESDAPTRILIRASSLPPAPRADRLLWVAALTTLMAIACLVLLAVELGYFGNAEVDQAQSALGDRRASGSSARRGRDPRREPIVELDRRRKRLAFLSADDEYLPDRTTAAAPARGRSIGSAETQDAVAGWKISTLASAVGGDGKPVHPPATSTRPSSSTTATCPTRDALSDGTSAHVGGDSANTSHRATPEMPRMST